MKKACSVFIALLTFFGVFAQSYSSRSLPLPIDTSLPLKPLLSTAPDGSVLCVLQRGLPTTIYWYDLKANKLTDSTKLDGSFETMEWSADSKTLAVYGEDGNNTLDKEVLLFRNRMLWNTIRMPLADETYGLRYSLLNFKLDSAATALVAVVYSLKESGAEYDHEIQSASFFRVNKKYNYRIIRMETVNGTVTDQMEMKASSARVEGKWKNNWLILQENFEADYQSGIELLAIDFMAKKFIPAASNGNLFLNRNLSEVKVAFDDDLYISDDRTVYRLSQTGRRFEQVMYLPSGRYSGIGSVSLNRHPGQNGVLAVEARTYRVAENELWIPGRKNSLEKIDIREAAPDAIFWQNDQPASLTLAGDSIFMSAYRSPQKKSDHRRLVVQQPFAADSRMTIPGTHFLIEYNRDSWQVIDLSSQLIVYRKKEKDGYGLRFVALDKQPFIIKFSGGDPEVIRIGQWDVPVASLSLKHSSLVYGSSLYQTLMKLESLAYNPATGLLSGVLSADSSFFLAAWKIADSWQVKYAVKIGREIPAENSSWSNSKSSPVSSKEFLAHFAFKLSEAGWKRSSIQMTTEAARELSKWEIPKQFRGTIEFGSEAQDFNIAKGRLLSGFRDGYVVADLNHPENTIYFSSKDLRDLFPNFQKAALDYGEMQIKKVDLSDNANVVVFSGNSSVLTYDLNTRRSQLSRLPNEYEMLGWDDQFLLEHENILISNEGWLDRFELKPVKGKMNSWYSNAALYIPGENRLVVNSGPNDRYLAVELGRMNISSTVAPPKLLQCFHQDTTFTFWSARKNMWVIAGTDGIALDTGQTIHNGTPARLFPSELNGAINFVQMIPERSEVVIGDAGSGQYECWDVNQESLVFRMLIVDEQNFFVQTASGYYYATPNALPGIGFVDKGRGIPAVLLDAGLNRPDMVMCDLLDTTNKNVSKLVQIYRRAALKKAGQALKIQDDRKAPVLAVADPKNTRVEQSLFPVKYTLKAGDRPINRLTITINNVPVWDTAFSRPVKELSAIKNIELSAGENQVVVMAKDEDNGSSLPVFQRIVYAPAKTISPKTYVIAVAVNNYADSSKNLRFAVKDGRDLLAAFSAMDPENVFADSLFNEAVTPDRLRALKKKLMQTNIEDRVIISFSGHGMLDTAMNFYYATADMDFTHPSKEGFAFAEMEQLLTGIPARKKLLLIDACNSGNIDRELVQTSAGGLGAHVTAQTDLAQTSRGVELPKPAGVSNQQIFNQLFSLSSSVSGAEIIAATAGNAYAYEAEQWKNGVFTYAILKALQQAPDLDKDYDGGVSVKELKRFVYPLVQDLTKGKQQPLAKYENPNFDWNLIDVKRDSD